MNELNKIIIPLAFFGLLAVFLIPTQTSAVQYVDDADFEIIPSTLTDISYNKAQQSASVSTILSVTVIPSG